MSKRKLEATRRNQERKAAAGRRTPPGYKGGAKRRRSFGGRRVLAGGGALLVVILLGAVLFATNVFGSDKLAGMKTLIKNGTCTETDFKKSMGRQHTTNPKTKVVYTQSDPPTSGKHYQVPPPLMIYDEPVPQWILLHALEHGNVLVQYGDKVSAADREALRAAVLSHRARTLMAPYPKLGDKVVYTAWQRMLRCTGFQKDALTGAQAKWAGTKGIAPEAAAFNTPGSGVLAGTGW
ncbi:MAG: hypothetical protein QOC86_2529 [Gaiellales bacterium]|jgi:hypothetical protein|nr:hypothetical protein [Gaiellales bacterium]